RRYGHADNSPPPSLAVIAIIRLPAVRIDQHLVCVRNPAEGFRISAIPIVRMKPLRLHSIDAADGLGVGVGADLQNLVMVDEHGLSGSSADSRDVFRVGPSNVVRPVVLV